MITVRRLATDRSLRVSRRTVFPRTIVRVLLALVCLGLFVRAATPTGFMWEWDDEAGTIVVALCSGQTPRTVLLDLETGRYREAAQSPVHPHGSALESDEPSSDTPPSDACPFGGLPSLAVLVDEGFALAIPALGLPVPVPFERTTCSRPTDSYRARAPPALLPV